ncbi:MAG: helix-turn-helix domain-containing protein [Rhodospirillaceae bacterium]|nr:helix-turn-helix domain-containing protein [Rhodospirillaceae bacterium]
MERKGRTESTKVLERGLMVLEHIVAHGVCNVQQISTETALSRQAVYRILESLSHTGFVYRRSPREAYRPTSKILSVAGQVPIAAIAAETARPLMADITKKTGWPVLLGQLDDLDVVVLEATDTVAKRNLKRIISGERIPQFRRAAGVICKAMLDPAEALRINKRTQQKYGPELFTHSAAYRESLLGLARKQGYVIFEPLRSAEGSIGVPVPGPRDSVFGLELRFIAASVKPEAIREDFLPRLQHAAQQISIQVAKYRSCRASIVQFLGGVK